MPENIHNISVTQVESFAASFAAFVTEVANAVRDAEQAQNIANAHSLQGWQKKALPLLQKHNAAIQAAAIAFQQGNAQPIMEYAERERGLAKDLDGFPLDFAGPEHQAKLEFLLTRVVTIAYQICSAAGIP